MGLLRFLNTNRSNEEQKLYDWLDDSTQNHTAIKSMLAEDTFDLSILKDYKQFDTNNAWSKISSQIDLEDTPVVKRNSFNLYKIAAIGAVLLASVFVMKNFNSLDPSSQMAVLTASDVANEVTLPDGSIVHIDKQSAISFDEDNFMTTRKVELTGRAFFEVAKVEGKNFVISADNVNVEVLGTRFEVNAKLDHKTVTVEEGKVRVYNDKSEVLLTANEKALISGTQITETFSDSENIISWKNGTLNFDETTMDVVISDLEDHFAIDIEVDNTTSKLDCPLTSMYKDQDLESILKEFNTIMGVTYKIEKDKVYISDICK